jgi:Chloroplast import apparatus Tic20-like
MSWQSSQTPADRFFGSLAYLLPIVDVYSFGRFVFEQFPIAQQLYQPLFPLLLIYSLPLGGFALFIGLYLGVVNNPRISRFIRFNVLQAILIGILISLCGLVRQYILLPIIGGSSVTQVLMNVIFFGTIAVSFYGIVMSALGKYTEFGQLSEAAHMQIDRF